MSIEVRYSSRKRKFKDGEFIAYFLFYEHKGKRKEKSTDIRLPIKSTKRQKEDAQRQIIAKAEKLSARLQEQKRLRKLRANSHTWDDTRKRFETHYLSRKSPNTQRSTIQTLKFFENICKPTVMDAITAETVSDYAVGLRARKARRRNSKGEYVETNVRDTTIATYLRNLRVFLNWAVDDGKLAKCPKFPTVDGKRSRGRGITTEEYERMLEACKEVRPEDFCQWQRLIKAMWLSALRLGEALSVSWDDDAGFQLDLNGPVGMFDIQAASQKSRRDEQSPLLPEFEQWMRDTPEAERKGLVFAPIGEDGLPYGMKNVQKYLAKIGRKANVYVDRELGKYVTAHDLRKGFGSRLAQRLPSIETLAHLMRHRSTKTTEEYYKSRSVNQTAAILRQLLPPVGKSNSEQSDSETQNSKNPANSHDN